MAYRARDLLRLAREDHTDQVRDLEDGALGFLAHLDTALDELVRRTLAAWTRLFGGPDATGAGGALDGLVSAVRTAVRRLLAPLGVQAAKALAKALAAAVKMGAAQGAVFLRAASGRAAGVPRVRVPRGLRREAAAVEGVVDDWRDRALALLERGRVSRWSHLLHAIGAARSAGSAVRGHGAWVVGQAVNTGLAAVAQAAGLARVWVSEADACVVCLVYAGRIARPGGSFPGGLSWDPNRRRPAAKPIDGPPAHINCRCRAVPWDQRWRADGVPFPLALQREAQRSVAYGRTTGAESRASRVRAAAELLRTQPELLPAVQARARTAVRTGHFPAAA